MLEFWRELREVSVGISYLVIRTDSAEWFERFGVSEMKNINNEMFRNTHLSSGVHKKCYTY